jgi:NADH-quinone oxidoreductase subunit J
MLFYLFAAVAVVASLLVIAQRNPIYSVLLLIASFGALSGLYVLLEAPFVAVIQIIVYAGAIMVLFLFVVMLLNAPREDAVRDEYTHTHRPERGDGVAPERVPGAGMKGAMRLGALLAAALVVELVWALSKGSETEFAGGGTSSVKALGQLLFTDYAFPFEVTSILILVAMVGAVVLARREAS